MSYKASPGNPVPTGQAPPGNYRYQGPPQGQPVGGRPGPPGYMGPPQMGGHHQMPHQMGPPQMGGVVPQLGGGVPQVGGARGLGGRSALMFIGLYRYEARTPEDLSFEKGIEALDNSYSTYIITKET